MLAVWLLGWCHMSLLGGLGDQALSWISIRGLLSQPELRRQINVHTYHEIYFTAVDLDMWPHYYILWSCAGLSVFDTS